MAFHSLYPLQIAKLALDLKKKFEYTSPAHTSSSAARSTAGGGTRKTETTATSSDMKSELFGRARNPESEREQDNTERDLSAILRGEEPTEGEGDVEEGEQGEGEEEEGEEANAYGGMLT